MRLTITKSDNLVYVGGLALSVDCSNLIDAEMPNAVVHAVQWHDTWGEIEYVRDPAIPMEQHVHPRRITDINQFQPYVDAWNKAKAARNAANPSR